MKEYIRKFCKDKFNIVLLIIQILALFFLALASISYVFTILFFVMESVFFIVLGIKFLVGTKKLKNNQELYNQLPYNETQRELLKKNDENEIKNNKFRGVMFIILGIILLFTLFSAMA